MTHSTEPSAILSHLHRTDGSATFSQNGYTIIGAVNGPIEVQRRDELPEEAVVDVIIRPAAGVGATRERHLESILQATLRQIVLIHNFPRTLLQVTLQVTDAPESETTSSKLNQPSSNLAILPALLHTALLALMSAAMPLATTVTSTLLAISTAPKRTILQNPSLIDIQKASSIHVLAYTGNGELLMVESEGEFTLEDWDEVCSLAEVLCNGAPDYDTMKDEGEEETSMAHFVKSVFQDKVATDLKWRT